MTASDVRCSNCGHDVPPFSYCVRCGSALHHDAGAGTGEPGEIGGPGQPGKGRRTGEYAAMPGEQVRAIRVATTLFPQLPRSHVESFRVSLVILAAAIVALAWLRLYPSALVVAALGVPLLATLYIRAVDVYEEEPLRVLAFTAGWGIAAGLLVGLLGRSIPAESPIASPGALPVDLLVRGVVMTVIGLAAAAAGPLVLLRYPRFNDVLDGTTFGVTAGAWFLGAQALVTGIELLGGGLRPPGEPTAWIVRLLTLGVVTPVLWSSALGSLLGALWLRYRAPAQTAGSLGRIGDPAVAALVAGLLVAAGAAGQMLLGATLALGWVAVLAAVGLVWLRRTIHLGLLEEASEIEIGPPIRCANCLRMTPRHTFCAHCGIALRALPKGRGTRGRGEPGA